MLRSKLPFIKSITLGALLFFFAFASALVPTPVHAQSSGVTCSMVNGVYTCTDGQTIPGVTCGMIGGIETCTDNSISNTGTTCVTGSDGSQSCLNNSSGTTASTTLSNLGKGLGSVPTAPSNGQSSGWLSQLTWWISNAIQTVFTALITLLRDLVTFVLGVVLSLVAGAISAIGVPSWISQYSLGSLLGQTGAVAGFFMSEFQVPAGLGLLGLGYAFRLVRKFLTLFQW
ncbi:MAG: hypothetical protein WA777_10750 [Rhodanobacter sp.]